MTCSIASFHYEICDMEGAHCTIHKENDFLFDLF